MKYLLFPVVVFLGLLPGLLAQQTPMTTTSTTHSKLYEITYERAKTADTPLKEYHPKLIETSSDFYPDFNSMGYYYLENEQLEEAKQAFEIYLTMAGQDAYAYYSMGEYYLATKEYDKAAQYFDQATALGMERAQARAAVARDEQLNSIVEEQKGGWE